MNINKPTLLNYPVAPAFKHVAEALTPALAEVVNENVRTGTLFCGPQGRVIGAEDLAFLGKVKDSLFYSPEDQRVAAKAFAMLAGPDLAAASVTAAPAGFVQPQGLQLTLPSRVYLDPSVVKGEGFAAKLAKILHDADPSASPLPAISVKQLFEAANDKALGALAGTARFLLDEVAANLAEMPSTRSVGSPQELATIGGQAIVGTKRTDSFIAHSMDASGAFDVNLRDGNYGGAPQFARETREFFDVVAPPGTTVVVVQPNAQRSETNADGVTPVSIPAGATVYFARNNERAQWTAPAAAERSPVLRAVADTETATSASLATVVTGAVPGDAIRNDVMKVTVTGDGTANVRVGEMGRAINGLLQTLRMATLGDVTVNIAQTQNGVEVTLSSKGQAFAEFDQRSLPPAQARAAFASGVAASLGGKFEKLEDTADALTWRMTLPA